jgi:hypothetical protein
MSNHKTEKDDLPKIGGREYWKGVNAPIIIRKERLVCWTVGDVLRDKIVSTGHKTSDEAAEFAISYAKQNCPDSIVAILADYGPDEPMIVQSTY